MASVEIWYGVLGEGSVFSVTIANDATVANLCAAIFKQERFEDRFSFPASAIKLFMPEDPRVGNEQIQGVSKRNALLTKGDVPESGFKEMDPMWKLNSANCFGPEFPVKDEEIHVLVKVPDGSLGGDMRTMPQEDQSGSVAPIPEVLWVGTHGSTGLLQSVDLADERTLPRTALVNQVIQRLDQAPVLLVKSPPMTGKTSLAALVCRELNARSIQQRQRVAIANFSVVLMMEDETFLDAFQRECKMSWKDVVNLPQRGYTVYVVVDEAQILYSTPPSSPKRKSSDFWALVKCVLNHEQLGLRVLLFAAYGSHPQYAELSTPVEFPVEVVLGNNQLNFGEDEILEYVTNWFSYVDTLGDMLSQFCAVLLALTGGHVGLCVTTIRTLNLVPQKWTRRGDSHPSAQDWIRMLHSGSLDRRSLGRPSLGRGADQELFKVLMSSRAVKVFHRLDEKHQGCLERLLYGMSTDDDEPILDYCVRISVLVRTEDGLQFSALVMWRYFVKMLVGPIERSAHSPATLQELILRSIRALDFNAIHNTLGQSVRSGIPLERAWQMEFYKAVYRCTPRSFTTSADVGALFGSPGFIDFTVHGGDHFWGIELLREGDQLFEHARRFDPGERYSMLQLSDYCLVDFRRVASIDETTRDIVAPDVDSLEKLYVVCYVKDLSHVAVFHSRNVHHLR